MDDYDIPADLVSDSRATTRSMVSLRCGRLVVPPWSKETRSRGSVGSERVYFVRSGTGTFLPVGAEAEWSYAVDAGSWCWVAPSVGHRFANESDLDLDVVEFSWDTSASLMRPGMGRMVRRLRDVVVEREGGREVKVVFRGATSEGGRIAAVEHSTYFPGGSSPLHRAVGMEEVFYFTRGAGKVRIEDSVIDVCAGEAVGVPSGVRHCVWNDGDAILEHVTCNVRFEEYLTRD